MPQDMQIKFPYITSLEIFLMHSSENIVLIPIPTTIFDMIVPCLLSIGRLHSNELCRQFQLYIRIHHVRQKISGDMNIEVKNFVE